MISVVRGIAGMLLGLALTSCSLSAAVDILVVYDNTATQADLGADWGFAAVVDTDAGRILMDTGAKPEILAMNLEKLRIDPASSHHILISHAHQDHTGGLAAVRGTPRIYLLDAFQPELAAAAQSQGMTVVRTRAGQLIEKDVYSTGLVSGEIPEQALVIDTPQGLIVITGCSHPGVVRMVEAAMAQHGNRPVRFLLGGFHMGQMSSEEIQQTIDHLRKLQVQAIAPTHCTGDLAIEMFKKAFGSAFQTAGVGRRFHFD
jgi:7,8-dihydropterin-6-yl-methyl-4-(beta-D-ribofuranosyl)aminobenzene 5'-phosphate synthase